MSTPLTIFCDRIIRYSFYALFVVVPLAFTNNTSELFELNKMWLTWGLTIIITVAWITKMALTREIRIQRTPLDIPILLFLLSQLIATIFSLDTRVSLWGYYSRFNGGFLSLLSYAILYYAFVTNFNLRNVVTSLKVILGTGIAVALWGFPSHFGYDPTCLLFRGTLDVSCWTEAFHPTVRIFSTLGQPAWLAAYFAVLIPITTAIALWYAQKTFDAKKKLSALLKNYWFVGFFLITTLFYLDLLYANTRGGFLAFWAANAVFWGVLFLNKLLPVKRYIQYFILFNGLFLLCNFFSGTPLRQLDIFTLSRVESLFSREQQAPTPAQAPAPAGGTESGNIRLFVWEGAINAWKANPIFGTGVETFAFAYYLHRPVGHNTTSEWDYLYNKAHNEYLNYLTTTGIVGLATYLSIIALFLFKTATNIVPKKENKAPVQKDLLSPLLLIAFPASFVSILISNFFGFSVVMINLFFFFLPAFYFFFANSLDEKKSYLFSFGNKNTNTLIHINPYQWTVITISSLLGLYFLFLLLRFWQADTAYALGYNLSRAGDVQGAYTNLSKAVAIRPNEPVFKDEFAINLASFGTALYQNNNATSGAQLATQAIAFSDEVTTNHPNNVTYWKSRVRIFYLLSQIDPQYNKPALEAIEQAAILAPTDAKVQYNLGVLYGQNGDTQKAIDTLTRTIQLKPDYRDPYFARGLFYRQLAVGTGEQVINEEAQQNAVKDMQYILKNIDPTDESAKTTLRGWGEEVK